MTKQDLIVTRTFQDGRPYFFAQGEEGSVYVHASQLANRSLFNTVAPGMRISAYVGDSPQGKLAAAVEIL